jgi:hypothetical protein
VPSATAMRGPVRRQLGPGGLDPASTTDGLSPHLLRQTLSSPLRRHDFAQGYFYLTIRRKCLPLGESARRGPTMATSIGRKHDPNYAIASTSVGDIYLSPSLLAVVTPDEAWLGIRELHFASIGDGGYPYVTNAGEMFPDEAQAAYGSAIAGVLGQLGAIGPQAASNMLDSRHGRRDDSRHGRRDLAPFSVSGVIASLRTAHRLRRANLGVWPKPKVDDFGHAARCVRRVDPRARVVSVPPRAGTQPFPCVSPENAAEAAALGAAGSR